MGNSVTDFFGDLNITLDKAIGKARVSFSINLEDRDAVTDFLAFITDYFFVNSK